MDCPDQLLPATLPGQVGRLRGMVRHLTPLL